MRQGLLTVQIQQGNCSLWWEVTASPQTAFTPPQAWGHQGRGSGSAQCRCELRDVESHCPDPLPTRAHRGTPSAPLCPLYYTRPSAQSSARQHCGDRQAEQGVLHRQKEVTPLISLIPSIPQDT